MSVSPPSGPPVDLPPPEPTGPPTPPVPEPDGGPQPARPDSDTRVPGPDGGTPRSGNSAAWVVTVVAAVVAVALAVLLFAFIRPASRNHDKASSPGFTADESAAMNAASVEAVNILTYTRKDFEADFQRALAGTTGAMTTDLQGLKTTTLNTMTTQKVDLKGQVTDVALETSSSQGMVVMVVANGFTVSDTGVSAPTGVQRVNLTLVKVKGKWLANNIQQVGIQ